MQVVMLPATLRGHRADQGLKHAKILGKFRQTLTFAATIDIFSVRALRNELQLMHESPRGCGTTHGGTRVKSL